VHATLTHHCGTPYRKFTVPSRGSTIQRSPPPLRLAPSSPRIASPARARDELADRALGREVGF